MRPLSVIVLGLRGIPNVQGGVETHTRELYPRLVALGVRVEVLVRAQFVSKAEQSYRGIRLTRICTSKRAGFESLIHSVIGVVYAGLRRPDILHIHAVGPAIVAPIARLLGIRVVVTHHGPDYQREKWGWFARLVLRTGERECCRTANAVIVISNGIARHLREQFGRESVLIPNGIAAPSVCQGDQHVRDLGLEPGRYFLMVGRMVPEKRQLDVIRAHELANIHGWKLVLVGAHQADDYSRTVETAARAAGVTLTGYLSGEPLRQLYSLSGAFILPSSYEGLPIALLEALSYGLPVLASDIEANREVGLEESCYFPVGDIAALASGLIRLAAAERDEAGRVALSKWAAQKYNWDHIAEQTLAVYRMVMEGRNLKSPGSALHG